MSAVPKLDRLVFEEEPHRYLLHGKEIPGITAVLRGAGLIDASWFSAAAADRGTAVHLAIQYAAEGDLDESSLAPSFAPYLAGWREFCAAVGWTPLEAPELLVASETLSFATRIDGVGEVFGRPTIVNWKTGARLAWHAIQSAGEALAYGEWIGKVAPHRLCRASVYLDDEGGYALIEHKKKSDVDVFRAAACLAAWKAGNGYREG